MYFVCTHLSRHTRCMRRFHFNIYEVHADFGNSLPYIRGTFAKYHFKMHKVCTCHPTSRYTRCTREISQSIRAVFTSRLHVLFRPTVCARHSKIVSHVRYTDQRLYAILDHRHAHTLIRFTSQIFTFRVFTLQLCKTYHLKQHYTLYPIP